MRKIAFFILTLGAAAASGQSVSSYVNYQGGIYSQTFNTLPDPGAASVNTGQVVTINGVTYTLPSTNGVPFALDDTTLGSGGVSIGGSGMAGWFGADALLDRFGATDGDQTTGGLLDFGPPQSGDRALGVISTSTTGAVYLGVAIKNGTGAAISAINLSFTGELWKQGTYPKTFLYAYTIDNAANSNLVSAATSTSAITLGTLTATPTSVAAADGTNPANQTPVSISSFVLATPLQPGGILWFTGQISDPTGNGQGFGIADFSFSGVGSPGITTQPESQSVSTGSTATLSVAAGGASAYQWMLNGAAIAGATGPTLALGNIGTNQAGTYSVAVTIGSSTVTSNAATVSVTSGSHPVNISARGNVGGGSDVLIAGFVVSGSTSETILARGIGPSLLAQGVPNALLTPQLAVYDSHNAIVASNTVWGGVTALSTVFTQVGAFPLSTNSADDAVVVTLAPGNYTAIVSGADGNTGVAMLEIYDVP